MGGMPASRIMIVEDGETIRLAVATALRSHGYDVSALRDGSGMETELAARHPDLVLLDVMLPGRDGFALLDLVRAASTAAVIMLTARDATVDRVHGLSAGADDYLVKPFAMAELIARVDAVLRRTRPGGAVLRVGDLELTPDANRVWRAETEIELTETERRVLSYLMAHREQVVSKTQILTAVWGYDGFDDNVVEVYVSSLRRKLEAGGRERLLHTVRGRGYRLGAP
jgi:DNA-binding response OmpR family regulator